MRLADYLNQNHYTHQSFAEQVGCSRVAITLYVNGKSRPGPKLCAAIRHATGGEVTADDHQTTYEAAHGQPEQSAGI